MGDLRELNEFFYITISNDKMSADIHCKKTSEEIDIQLKNPLLIQFLNDNQINFGIDKKAIDLLLNKASLEEFPITIAKGKFPVAGVDGEITFIQEGRSIVSRGDNWNFRDIMQASTVNAGDKLAVITLPTEGQNGMDVQGTTLARKPGKIVTLQAGKNVIYKAEDRAFYAIKDGQVKVSEQYIEVDEVYTVNETLSMKTGDLNFVGSIVIRGDVPTGSTVEATGDIMIYGIVEAATIIAGGSIYITEGLSGLGKGYIKAEQDIYIGYINQGIAEAEQSIYVENSIMHSKCIAKEHIFCQHGNIIGGSISVGKSIESGDVGNRLSTETSINLGLKKEIDDKQTNLESEKEVLTATLKKLEIIGKKLMSSQAHPDAKTRITMLRQRRSYEQIKEKINQINVKLERMNFYLGSEEKAYLIVENTLHPNVVISFGKYKRKINKSRRNVQLQLVNKDIVIHALK